MWTGQWFRSVRSGVGSRTSAEHKFNQVLSRRRARACDAGSGGRAGRCGPGRRGGATQPGPTARLGVNGEVVHRGATWRCSRLLPRSAQPVVLVWRQVLRWMLLRADTARRIVPCRFAGWLLLLLADGSRWGAVVSGATREPVEWPHPSKSMLCSQKPGK